MGEIRFVGTGETRGYPYLVCKKCIGNMHKGNRILIQVIIAERDGHIVLPLSVRTTYIRTSVTRFRIVIVSATPPKVFEAGT